MGFTNEMASRLKECTKLDVSFVVEFIIVITKIFFRKNCKRKGERF